MFTMLYAFLRVAGFVLAIGLVVYAVYKAMKGISTTVHGKTASDVSIDDTVKVLNLAVGQKFAPILQRIVVPCFWERSGLGSPEAYEKARWGEAGYMKDFDLFVLRGMVGKVAERISKSNGSLSQAAITQYILANSEKIAVFHYGVRLSKVSDEEPIQTCEVERRYKITTYQSTPTKCSQVEQVTLDSLRLDGSTCFIFRHEGQLIKRQHDYLLVDPRDPVELYFLTLRSAKIRTTPPSNE